MLAQIGCPDSRPTRAARELVRLRCSQSVHGKQAEKWAGIEETWAYEVLIVCFLVSTALREGCKQERKTGKIRSDYDLSVVANNFETGYDNPGVTRL